MSIRPFDRREVCLFFVVVGIALSSATASGCGSTCATDCPANVFDIFATTGENLNLATVQLVGPGCPPVLAGCRGDSTGNNPCVRLSIIATQPGSCEVDFTFADGRAPLSVQTAFAPETHQGCCHGLPVLGPTSYTVPPLNGGPTIDAGPDGSDAAPDVGAGDTGAGADGTDEAPIGGDGNDAA